MQFIRSVLVQDESISAGDIKNYDLPVNPLSHIIFTLKGLNVTDEASLSEILARLEKIEVLYHGSSVISLSGADLFALNVIMLGKEPILANQVADDNATRYLSLIIPFGRKLFNPAECLPETSKGELKLRVTFSSTETAIDGLILQVETVELIGATPEKFLKATTITKTPETGDNDIDLPIGNKLAGVLLFGTTIVAGTSWTNTIEKVKFLVDNIEYDYSEANWESLHGDLMTKIGQKENYDGSADNDDVAHYALLDFSPNDGDDFLVDTSGKSRVHLRINAGDTNEIRVIPIELTSKGE